MFKTILVTAASAAALTLMAGCGSSSPSSSAPVTGTQAANALVCRHYLAQRAHVKNLTQPTIADAEQFIADITVDADQSTGRLHTNLAAMVRTDTAQGSAYYDASARVYRDCTR